MPHYLNEHVLREARDAFDPDSNAAGYVGMSRAENKLSDVELRDKLALIAGSAATPCPVRAFGYDAMTGSLAFRDALARFMARTVFGGVGVQFDACELVVLCGAGTVLQQLFFCLGDEGDAVLLPTPTYMGFVVDLERTNALHIEYVKCDPASGFALTTEALDGALAACKHAVRALLFTNPCNPRGVVASAEHVRAIAEWAIARRIHVVFDEIYALSTFGGEFVSVAAVLGGRLGDYVHIVWGFSKDFSASGLRCGVLVSQNKRVLAGMDGLAYWGVVSGHTQFLLQHAIDDTAWVDGYLAESRKRLACSYAIVAAALDEARIPFTPAVSGLFVLLDLRAFLPEPPTWEAERALSNDVIIGQANTTLTPGEICHVLVPGFFRLCYAACTPVALRAALERLTRALGPFRRA